MMLNDHTHKSLGGVWSLKICFSEWFKTTIPMRIQGLLDCLANKDGYDIAIGQWVSCYEAIFQQQSGQRVLLGNIRRIHLLSLCTSSPSVWISLKPSISCALSGRRAIPMSIIWFNLRPSLPTIAASSPSCPFAIFSFSIQPSQDMSHTLSPVRLVPGLVAVFRF